MNYHVFTKGIRLPEPSAGNRATQVGSSHHCTGQIVIGDGPGRLHGTDSHLEMNSTLMLAARAETAALFEQIAFVWRDAKGESHTHYIDLVVQQTDGRRVGYAVRPWKRISVEYLTDLARIKAQAIASGFLWDFRIFSDRDVNPIDLFNAKLLHAVRTGEPQADATARAAAATISGIASIGALVAQTGLEGTGFRAIVRLIRSGHLKPVRRGRIDYETEVFKAQAL